MLKPIYAYVLANTKLDKNVDYVRLCSNFIYFHCPLNYLFHMTNLTASVQDGEDNTNLIKIMQISLQVTINTREYKLNLVFFTSLSANFDKQFVKETSFKSS